MPTVRTTNTSGQTAEVVVDDDMADTLRAKARREDSGLESVEVVSDNGPDDAPGEAPVQYRPRSAAVAPGPDGETDDGDDDGDIDALRAEYETVIGQAPDGRWKAPRLRKEIDAHNAKG